MERSENPDIHKIAKRRKVRLRLEPFRPQRTRLTLNAVYDATDIAVKDPAAVSALIFRERQPVFEERHIRRATRSTFWTRIRAARGYRNGGGACGHIVSRRRCGGRDEERVAPACVPTVLHSLDSERGGHTGYGPDYDKGWQFEANNFDADVGEDIGDERQRGSAIALTFWSVTSAASSRGGTRRRASKSSKARTTAVIFFDVAQASTTLAHAVTGGLRRSTYTTSYKYFILA